MNPHWPKVCLENIKDFTLSLFYGWFINQIQLDTKLFGEDSSLQIGLVLGQGSNPVHADSKFGIFGGFVVLFW